MATPITLEAFNALGAIDKIRLKNGRCINVLTDTGIITVSNINNVISCSCVQDPCPHTENVLPLTPADVLLKKKEEEEEDAYYKALEEEGAERFAEELAELRMEEEGG
jgi:hypothetical protein